MMADKYMYVKYLGGEFSMISKARAERTGVDGKIGVDPDDIVRVINPSHYSRHEDYGELSGRYKLAPEYRNIWVPKGCCVPSAPIFLGGE